MEEAQTKKKAALYVRVSTDAQAEEGYSVEAQKEKLRAQCVVKGYEDYAFYVDAGWSGSNLERPAMRQMIEDIRKNEIFCVMVYKLDRVSRSQKDTLFLIEDILLPNGVEFLSLNESFDTGNSYGRAMIGILSAFAQLERENIRERTRMGMQERIKAGYWRGGGKVPFGYDYDSAQGTLVPNADAPKVYKMYQMYLEGMSAQKIADALGIKYDRIVTQILKRKSNTGVILYKGMEYPGRHKAIIPGEMYTQAMALMQKRSYNRNYADSPYLLTGLVECGVCGAKMRYFKSRDAKSDDGCKLTLACNSRYKSKAYLVKDPDCDNELFDAKDLEKRVVSELFRIALEVDALQEPKESLFLDMARELRQRCTLLKNRIKKLYVRYGDEADELLLETIRDSKAELAKLEKRIAVEEESRSLLAQSRRELEKLPTIKDNWAQMNMTERRELLRSIIEKIVVLHHKVTIYYTFLQE